MCDDDKDISITDSGDVLNCVIMTKISDSRTDRVAVLNCVILADVTQRNCPLCCTD